MTLPEEVERASREDLRLAGLLHDLAHDEASTVREIARRYGYSYGQARDWQRRAGISRETGDKARLLAYEIPGPEPSVSAVLQVLRERPGLYRDEVAGKLGISPLWVDLIAKTHGISLPRPKGDAYEMIARNERIVADFRAGITRQALAVRYGISRSRINQILREEGGF